jgi:hypothetical protein
MGLDMTGEERVQGLHGCQSTAPRWMSGGEEEDQDRQSHEPP